MKDSTRVTGQPAPPTPAQPTCWVKCPKCGQGVAIWTASGVCKCGAFVCYDGTELAAAQPLTPPQPPLEERLRDKLLDSRTKLLQRFMKACGGTDYDTPETILARIEQAAPPSLTPPDVSEFVADVFAALRKVDWAAFSEDERRARKQEFVRAEFQSYLERTLAKLRFIEETRRASLTAEELAPIFVMKAHWDEHYALYMAKWLCSLPGIKVVKE